MTSCFFGTKSCRREPSGTRFDVNQYADCDRVVEVMNRTGPSAARYVTLDDWVDVLPRTDLSGVFCGGTAYEAARISGCPWLAAWPVASKAQTTERIRVIGVLEILGADDP